MISELWTWADAAMNIPVIWANQDGSQPAEPFAYIQITATSREGLPHLAAPDDAGLAVISQGQLFTASIQTVGAGVTGPLQDLRDSLERVTVQRELRSSGFAYVRVLSEPTDLPQVTGSTWQQRAALDVQFRAAREITDDVGLIESVGLAGGDGNASDNGATVGGA